MKVSEKHSGTHGEVNLKFFVDWLGDRLEEIDKKWVGAQKRGDTFESERHHDLYDSYKRVIDDIEQIERGN